MERGNLIPGARVGRLTLLEEAPAGGRRRWVCRCECGNERTVMEQHLRSGHTKSCGCLSRETARDKAADLTGRRFGHLTAVAPTQRRRRTSVIWQCRCDCGGEVFVESDALLRGHTQSCGCLREARRKENMEKAIHFVDGTCIEKIACQKEIATNTSGYRGVWALKNGKWRASITFKGKRTDLGTHNTFEEAVAARRKGELVIEEFLEAYYAETKPKGQTL